MAKWRHNSVENRRRMAVINVVGALGDMRDKIDWALEVIKEVGGGRLLTNAERADFVGAMVVGVINGDGNADEVLDAMERRDSLALAKAGIVRQTIVDGFVDEIDRLLGTIRWGVAILSALESAEQDAKEAACE